MSSLACRPDDPGDYERTCGRGRCLLLRSLPAAKRRDARALAARAEKVETAQPPLRVGNPAAEGVSFRVESPTGRLGGLRGSAGLRSPLPSQTGERLLDRSSGLLIAIQKTGTA